MRWGLIGLVTLAAAGHLLAMGTWLAYYTWWAPNRHHAIVFAIAVGTTLAFYGTYLLIVRRLERP